MSEKVKGSIFPLAALAVGVVAAVLLGEVALRVFGIQPLYMFERGMFVSSDQYGYQLAPNTTKRHAQPEYDYEIKTNSFGFRGPEPNPTKAHRVMVLGDSLGMGQGVAEGKQLTSVSQQYFDKSRGDVDIFNTSVAGYYTWNQWQVVKTLAVRYRPQLIVVLLYWNDVGMPKSLEVQNGYLVLGAERGWKGKMREWLNNNSRVYCLVKKVYYNLKDQQKELQRGKTGRYSIEDLQKTVDLLVNIRNEAKITNSRVMVTLLPLGGIYEGDEAFQKSKRWLVERLHEQHIDIRDWMAINADNKEQLIFPIDHHWNEQGHEYFSQQLNRLIEGHFGFSS